MVGGRAVIILVLDPKPDSELWQFLSFLNSNFNSSPQISNSIDGSKSSAAADFILWFFNCTMELIRLLN